MKRSTCKPMFGLSKIQAGDIVLYNNPTSSRVRHNIITEVIEVRGLLWWKKVVIRWPTCGADGAVCAAKYVTVLPVTRGHPLLIPAKCTAKLEAGFQELDLDQLLYVD